MCKLSVCKLFSASKWLCMPALSVKALILKA